MCNKNKVFIEREQAVPSRLHKTYRPTPRHLFQQNSWLLSHNV